MIVPVAGSVLLILIAGLTLRSAGIATSVIQIALDGANHVERLQILREFVQGLGDKEIEQLKRSP